VAQRQFRERQQGDPGRQLGANVVSGLVLFRRDPPGLTVTGQATLRGAGSAARTSAIAQAVANAASQAKAAASAAGISLGRVTIMQVAAPYYRYPLAVGAAQVQLPAWQRARRDRLGTRIAAAYLLMRAATALVHTIWPPECGLRAGRCRWRTGCVTSHDFPSRLEARHARL